MLEQISIDEYLKSRDKKREIPEGWERIPDTAEVVAISKPTDFIEGDFVDKVAEGRVNRIPCLIGYLEGVSGFGECFFELVPKYFKRTKINPCPLKDYCVNMPAGCEGKTWWCGRTREEVEI